jgi:ACR3 family arsenite transporter
MLRLLGPERFQTRFLPFFAPWSLIGLLYVIIIIFAEQGRPSFLSHFLLSLTTLS